MVNLLMIEVLCDDELFVFAESLKYGKRKDLSEKETAPTAWCVPMQDQAWESCMEDPPPNACFNIITTVENQYSFFYSCFPKAGTRQMQEWTNPSRLILRLAFASLSRCAQWHSSGSYWLVLEGLVHLLAAIG